jgi:hypothetical protein
VLDVDLGCDPVEDDGQARWEQKSDAARKGDQPLAERDLEPLLFRAKLSRAPRARMVTPVAPVKVVKKVQTRTTMITIPPGSQPTKALNSLTRRFPAWLSERMKPARANRGMAGML